jgi:hypothetical protein
MISLALTSAFIAAGAYLRARRLRTRAVVLGAPLVYRRAELDAAVVIRLHRGRP